MNRRPYAFSGSSVGPLALRFKRLRRARNLRRHLRRYAGLLGGNVPREQAEDLKTLRKGLEFSQAYLKISRAFLDAADESQLVQSHVAFVDNALYACTALLSGCQVFNDVSEKEQKSLIVVGNFMFCRIEENIGSLYLKMNTSKLTKSFSSKVAKSRGTSYEVLVGNDSQGIIPLVPGKKLQIPFFPPWNKETSLTVRKIKTTEEKDVPYLTGLINLLDDPDICKRGIYLENFYTGEKKKKSFCFSYKPEKIAEPLPDFLFRKLRTLPKPS